MGMRTGMATRFEAMLATAMMLPDSDAAARMASWRQIVDILAQAGAGLPEEARALASARLDTLRRDVPDGVRRLAAASLSGRTRDAGIARLFATDAPGIAAPFLARVDLDDADWADLVPTMPPTSRNILRNRRDLSPMVTDLLRRFAPGDMALPGGVAVPTVAPGVTQIRDLVDRIAAYRERMPLPSAGISAPEPDASFVFETMIDGMIDWVEGVPREAIVGISISQAADYGCPGVDGQAAGAWRRRAPFSDARLAVAGIGPAGGDWLISAAPLFNPRDGRFFGYRGTARRPLPGERAGGASPTGGIASDSLRQLVHELRTPLNAIHGFAEMIDRQLLGPAAMRYRERARAIIAEADRLVAMVDDLDTAAQIDTGRIVVDFPESLDLGQIVGNIVAGHRKAMEARGLAIALNGRMDLPPIAASGVATERMIGRLFASAAGVAAAGETVHVEVKAHVGGAACSISRPAALAGRDERTLLDPGYGPDGDWPEAPLLGLGFTLRLVGRMAAQAGGKLAILPDRFELMLPAAQDRADGQTA